ncbi:carboxypeptidase-like regulatory domain-containing protein [Aquimarina algicola]|uniref:Carboxypeptidase-like regulatory domain-containing protein n=1 Tax=Aquimarina algicola TaxID=2589995 RepID=A0A504J3K4_9FLAO|nr:carboxypeptidase-like regulatory domain-containing protein [Aquimarina algicola]TPN82163.1 hypothetical protein FHK87_22320 [Aquimarina algicola]
MNHKYLCCVVKLFIVLSSCNSNAQEIELMGVIQSFSNEISDVLVINLNSKKSTITNAKGGFTIAVNKNDTLQFSAITYVTKKVMITDSILDQGMMIVVLKEKTINLEEVVVRPYDLTGNINGDIQKIKLSPVIKASSLGLPEAKLKVKTKNERLLFEANHGKAVKIQGTPFGVGLIVNVHKILNKISGRTKSLKGRVALDEKVKVEDEIINMFSEIEIAEELQIPQSHVERFLQYAMNQEAFTELIDAKNAFQVWEYIKDSSLSYKKEHGLGE